MSFTLEQKIGFLNRLIERCDRLAFEHGDRVGCDMHCNQILKAIEADLRTVQALKGFDKQGIH
jgi:hypothetical protein